MNNRLKQQLTSSANALYSQFSGQTPWGTCLTMSAMDMCESDPMSAVYIQAVAECLSKDESACCGKCEKNN